MHKTDHSVDGDEVEGQEDLCHFVGSDGFDVAAAIQQQLS